MKIAASLFVVPFFLFIQLYSTAQVGDFLENNNNWKPIDFDYKNEILLIEIGSNWSKTQLEKMKRYMLKKYPHEYLFVDSLQFVYNYANSKYDFENTDKYRFVLKPTFKLIAVNVPNSNSLARAHDFYFLDRKKNVTYSETGIYCSWPKMVLKQIIEQIQLTD